MLSKLALALLLLASATPTVAPKPAPGSYGFNWLSPNSQCREVTAKDLAKVSKCEVTPNAFGLDRQSHMCKLSAKVELVVYDTKAHCQEAWETMQANGE